MNHIEITGPDASYFNYTAGLNGSLGAGVGVAGVYLNDDVVLDAAAKPFYQFTVSVRGGSPQATVTTSHTLSVISRNVAPILDATASPALPLASDNSAEPFGLDEF